MILFASVSLLAMALVDAQSPSVASPPDPGPEACAVCHSGIWETYRRTGMGRSFYRPSPASTVEDFTKKNTFYHPPSDSYFAMLQRDGKYYQRRYQLDPAGKQINVMEKQVDYILGSGNHSRAYLHRTSRNTLVELPLAWYAEKGGYWAMNPGYDRPDHEGFRREITYDCMFCHNAYPQIPAGKEKPFSDPVYAAKLPEGIDCRRCHGSGSRHMQLAKTPGASAGAIRNSILNPSRLNADRQMEVCMQCHLETTSFPLPNALPRYERGPFSYQPGEPLAAFILNFDHAPGKGRDDKFEIVNAAYRLRRSACFLKSNGALRCTTCHNPHDIPRGPQAAQHYQAVCRQCHASAFDQRVAAGTHPSATDCIDCHMPKRRTEDVVHVVATDHFIQRRKSSGDLLADIAERHETGATAYRGEVVPYYPAKLPATPENDLYLAIAQVIQKSNLRAGTGQLSAAIAKYHPQRAEYYLELAEAWQNQGQLSKALPFYEEAARRDPQSAAILRKYGSALRHAGRFAEAVKTLEEAATAAPANAATWHELGLALRAQGKMGEAAAALEKAIALDPDLSEAYNNLGIIWLAAGDRARAETAFREAIRIQPGYADAHGNLANLLASANDYDQAREHFVIALRFHPDDAAIHYNYGMLLGNIRQYDAAQQEMEAALRADPQLADAHLLLGDLLMAKDQTQAALAHYREALRLQPESGRAHLALAAALASAGDIDNAVPHLRKAATDRDPAVRDEATRVLRQLGK